MVSQLRIYIHDFPIGAIGSINETNVQPIVDEGADGISVISAITRSTNIDKTVKYFLRYFT